MSGFAVRTDGTGWRAVSSQDDCLEFEVYQEEAPSLIHPTGVMKVTMRQARLALLEIGKLFDVTDIINKLPEPPRTAAMIEWDYASEVERGSSIIAMLAPQLFLSEEEVDALFARAATL